MRSSNEKGPSIAAHTCYIKHNINMGNRWISFHKNAFEYILETIVDGPSLSLAFSQLTSFSLAPSSKRRSILNLLLSFITPYSIWIVDIHQYCHLFQSTVERYNTVLRLMIIDNECQHSCYVQSKILQKLFFSIIQRLEGNFTKILVTTTPIFKFNCLNLHNIFFSFNHFKKIGSHENQGTCCPEPLITNNFCIFS